MAPGVDNPQVTQYDPNEVGQLEPIDDTVRQVAYAVGTMIREADEALKPTHPGWSQFFHDLYMILDNEFGQ